MAYAWFRRIFGHVEPWEGLQQICADDLQIFLNTFEFIEHGYRAWPARRTLQLFHAHTLEPYGLMSDQREAMHAPGNVIIQIDKHPYRFPKRTMVIH